MKAQVIVRLKGEVLDPEGDAIRKALERLNFGNVKDVRVGRIVELELTGSDAAAIETELKKMADALLANPVTEDYEVVLKK